MNAWDQMRDALAEADNIDSAIGQHANRMGELLTRHGGANLRRVSAYELKRLKRALRDYDMTTGRWKP